VALTAREALAMAVIVPPADSAHPTYFKESSASSLTSACLSAGERTSIRSEYMQSAGTWFPRKSGVPTGVDGGLIQLLSGYQSCTG
jgi:hypothetical protein